MLNTPPTPDETVRRPAPTALDELRERMLKHGAATLSDAELLSLLIRHTDGYISAYAHLQQMLVSQGSRVEAGQQIALLGSSGTTQAMLEFQIRKNGKPLDPLLLLPKS